ncbi:hypothetical protein B0J13DRAFT_574132 [Dactylonectria estremocensis]|uniref:Apple domain-containing protein n=1 Tax=Dactylonectria estremocensis TaxID=1079267 RepID=A0A9P9D6I0_9HYPO|nr:hypothetical protein B0J13DRAFT_574132 [Dactylonectria estremocensis]
MRRLFVALVFSIWTIIANCGLLSEPTQRYSIAYNEQPPAPTQPTEAFKLGQLAERRDTKLEDHTFTLTIAPNPTCGFLSGSPGNAITCENGQRCFWEQDYLSAIFCGTDSNAEVHLACVERETATNPEFCDNVCQSNRAILRCTNTSSPYCRTYAYPDGVHDFRCASTIVPSPESVWFTHSEQNDRNFSTILYSDGLSITLRDSVTLSTTSSTATTSPLKSKDDGSPNIGPIVGGAIGGFAVLSLLVLGIIWLLRRTKTLALPPLVDPRLVKPGRPSLVSSELPNSTITVPSATYPPTQPNWANPSQIPEDVVIEYHEMSGDNDPRIWELQE